MLWLFSDVISTAEIIKWWMRCECNDEKCNLEENCQGLGPEIHPKDLTNSMWKANQGIHWSEKVTRYRCAIFFGEKLQRKGLGRKEVVVAYVKGNRVKLVGFEVSTAVIKRTVLQSITSQPTLRRNLLLPSSGPNKPSKIPAWKQVETGKSQARESGPFHSNLYLPDRITGFSPEKISEDSVFMTFRFCTQFLEQLFYLKSIHYNFLWSPIQYIIHSHLHIRPCFFMQLM
jgi:hypothetical protein